MDLSPSRLATRRARLGVLSCYRGRGWRSGITTKYSASRATPRKQDRKSTRLNSSHSSISYAVFCLKKKNETDPRFVSGAMAKADKELLEGRLQAGTSAVYDKLLDLVGLGRTSAADKGQDTRD